jgi:cytidine deaminase
MKKIILQTTYKSYDSEQELSLADRALLLSAKEASAKAYAPYSKFKVGVALLLADGSIILGSNQENASFPVSICAERVALSALAASGNKKPVKTISIYCDNNPKHAPAAPCGMCRQALLEQESRQKNNIRILLSGNGSEVIEISSVDDILPLGFSGDDLKQSPFSA